MDDLVRIEGCGECQRDMRHVVFSFERGYGDTGMQQVEMPVEEFIIGCILGRDSDNFLFVGYECIAVGVGNEKPPFIGYSYSGCFIFFVAFLCLFGCREESLSSSFTGFARFPKDCHKETFAPGTVGHEAIGGQIANECRRYVPSWVDIDCERYGPELFSEETDHLLVFFGVVGTGAVNEQSAGA